MINSFRQKDGRVGVMIWGSLTKEPQMKTTKNGDPMCWFYIRYGFEPVSNPADKPQAKSIKVLCFKDAANACAGLEAWESVFICGELKENEYNGNKEYNVVADIVLAPNAQVAALAALNAVRNMDGGNTEGKKTGTNVSAKDSDDGFTDIDQSVIDDIFPGL